MDFSVDEDALALADALADFFDRRDDARHIASAASTGGGLNRARWTALCELGMPVLRVAEPQGLGMGLLAATLAAEKVGSVLVPEPVSATIALARAWAQHGGAGAVLESLSDGSMMIWFDPHATAKVSERGIVSGTVVAMADNCIDYVAVLAWTENQGRARLAVINAQSLTLPTDYEDVDPGRPTVRYQMKNVVPEHFIDLSASAAEDLIAESCILNSGELVGGMQAVLFETLRYVREREQFGRSIGSFQTVKHRLADMYVAAEQARAAVQLAAVTADAGGPATSTAAAVAAQWIARTAIELCDGAIHLHGAMGYAWEVDVHQFLRRALRSRQLWAAWIRQHEALVA